MLRKISRFFAWIFDEICPSCNSLWSFKADYDTLDRGYIQFLKCETCGYKKPAVFDG
jgi:DNA-directed RNA polymerase subunit M/transcription elongation factor TFIIS